MAAGFESLDQKISHLNMENPEPVVVWKEKWALQKQPTKAGASSGCYCLCPECLQYELRLEKLEEDGSALK